MINGDASGKFEDAKPDLLMAEQIFRELNEQQAVARIMVNRSIMEQFISSFDIALDIARNGVAFCTRIGDIQGKACGLICLVSIYIQRAAFADEPQRQDILQQAMEIIKEIEEINKVRQENFIHVLCLANRGMVFILENNHQKALELFREVISESKKSGDFFNLFDAEVVVAGLLKDENKLLTLIETAEEKQYKQGSLHVCREISRLFESNGKNKDVYDQKAKEISDDLGWGYDPRQSIYMGWYAGVFI
jgi:tetratricopeptide (TPR) repeat protein